MKQNASQLHLLKLINPTKLRYYLKDMGWAEEATQKNSMMKFRSPRAIGANGSEYINIFIPINDSIIDYPRTVEYALKVLSAFEKRPTTEIIYQILNFADCLKTKILGASAGMIPLNQGIFLYRGVLDLITFSACGEFDSQTKKFPRKMEKASKYAETSLLGQSELGSYVANIFLPLGRHPPDYPWIAADPFPRKVVLRILRGLRDLADSVTEKDVYPIIDNYKKGLNANMCDSIIDIITSGMGNRVILSAILEPTFEIPVGISTNFVLNPSDKFYLNEARNILGVGAQQEEERPFIGYVKLLSRPEEREKGVIVLISPDPITNKSINIKMELSPSDYHKAVDAHDLKLYVKVRGILEKAGYRWFLRDAHDLEIFDEDSEEPWRAFTGS